MFSQPTIEKIQSYVYALVDERNHKIFYIGKGQGNRAFQHAQDALSNSLASDKLDLIRDILNQNFDVRIYILRHGLTSEEALLVESVLIDLFTCEGMIFPVSLTNAVSGHDQSEYGIMTAEEVEAKYSCEALDTTNIEHKLLAININKMFGISSNYDATRSSWVLSPAKANLADYVVCEVNGVIKDVFEVDKNGWVASASNAGRYEFQGTQAPQAILALYVNKRIAKKHGQANPIKYLF